MEEQDKDQNVDRVEIEYYTDPLCCWSWAFEPQWRRLRYEYTGKIVWRYRMGGLLPNWSSYNDPMNSVAKPIQMGPVWTEAHHLSGMPINNRIWFENPPDSSYPACLAAKCAALQSPDAAEAYLRKIREAVMIAGKNISKQAVLLEIGDGLAEELPRIFNASRFSNDLKQNAGMEGFREDLQKARYHKISRFPTLTLHQPNKPGVMITGYRPYEALVAALKQAAPEITPARHASDEDSYNSFWGDTTSAELAEAMSAATQKA